MYIKIYKCWYLIYCGQLGCSSESSAAFSGFVEIKYLANCGNNFTISDMVIFELADRMTPAAQVTEIPGLVQFFHKYSTHTDCGVSSLSYIVTGTVVEPHRKGIRSASHWSRTRTTNQMTTVIRPMEGVKRQKKLVKFKVPTAETMKRVV